MGQEAKCDRWDECQKRDEDMRHMLEKLSDEKREDHRDIWEAIKKTNENVSGLTASLSGLAGRVVGYTMAGSLVVGIVAFVAAKVFH